MTIALRKKKRPTARKRRKKRRAIRPILRLTMSRDGRSQGAVTVLVTGPAVTVAEDTAAEASAAVSVVAVAFRADFRAAGSAAVAVALAAALAEVVPHRSDVVGGHPLELCRQVPDRVAREWEVPPELPLELHR
jgi:hypothetical protein